MARLRRLDGRTQHEANVDLVQEAMTRWRLQNDPGDFDGPTMAEFIVIVLEQERRLR